MQSCEEGSFLRYIVEPLAHVLSLFLKSGVVPSDLKVVKVTPLLKSGDR